MVVFGIQNVGFKLVICKIKLKLLEDIVQLFFLDND